MTAFEGSAIALSDNSDSGDFEALEEGGLSKTKEIEAISNPLDTLASAAEAISPPKKNHVLSLLGIPKSLLAVNQISSLPKAPELSVGASLRANLDKAINAAMRF